MNQTSACANATALSSADACDVSAFANSVPLPPPPPPALSTSAPEVSSKGGGRVGKEDGADVVDKEDDVIDFTQVRPSLIGAGSECGAVATYRDCRLGAADTPIR